MVKSLLDEMIDDGTIKRVEIDGLANVPVRTHRLAAVGQSRRREPATPAREAMVNVEPTGVDGAWRWRYCGALASRTARTVAGPYGISSASNASRAMSG